MDRGTRRQKAGSVSAAHNRLSDPHPQSSALAGPCDAGRRQEVQRRAGTICRRLSGRLSGVCAKGTLATCRLLVKRATFCRGPDDSGARRRVRRGERGRCGHGLRHHRQGLAVKATIYQGGAEYLSLDDEHLFDMEFRAYQQAKLGSRGLDDTAHSLRGSVALSPARPGPSARASAKPCSLRLPCRRDRSSWSCSRRAGGRTRAALPVAGCGRGHGRD